MLRWTRSLGDGHIAAGPGTVSMARQYTSKYTFGAEFSSIAHTQSGSANIQDRPWISPNSSSADWQTAAYTA